MAVSKKGSSPRVLWKGEQDDEGERFAKTSASTRPKPKPKGKAHGKSAGKGTESPAHKRSTAAKAASSTRRSSA
jgi:hypothetical protein